MVPFLLTDADALALAAFLGGLPAAAAAAYVAWLQRRRGQDVAVIREKVEETHTQVSVNGHSCERPTVLDKLEDTLAEVRALRSDMGDVQRDMRRTEGKLDKHVEWHLDGTARGR